MTIFNLAVLESPSKLRQTNGPLMEMKNAITKEAVNMCVFCFIVSYRGV